MTRKYVNCAPREVVHFRKLEAPHLFQGEA